MVGKASSKSVFIYCKIEIDTCLNRQSYIKFLRNAKKSKLLRIKKTIFNPQQNNFQLNYQSFHSFILFRLCAVLRLDSLFDALCALIQVFVKCVASLARVIECGVGKVYGLRTFAGNVQKLLQCLCRNVRISRRVSGFECL